MQLKDEMTLQNIISKSLMTYTRMQAATHMFLDYEILHTLHGKL